jgi:AcrR family transcriptional regulator
MTTTSKAASKAPSKAASKAATTKRGSATVQASARERLLAAANELFYDEGVHTVGIDRVIERAGVAKASLYNTFGSKDELVRAYLHGRRDANVRRITDAMSTGTTPRDKLLAIFESQAPVFARSDFRGCAFVAAAAESGVDTDVQREADTYRHWLRDTFRELAREGGAADPEATSRRLQLVYDGAITLARMDRDPEAARTSRAVAALVIDAALASEA